jgi:hypothetical protein
MALPPRDPQHLFLRTRPARGKLIRLGAAAGGGADGNQTLTFQFNPETVTRTRSGRWEPRRRRRNGPKAVSPQEARGELGGHGSSAILAESEAIAFRIVLDSTEAILRGEGDDDTSGAWEAGVLPELAFLEVVSLGQEPEPDPRGTPPKGGEIRPIRPDELLLQLGETRWFPCVLTELTITEQRFTPELIPVRAEVDLRLTVLEPVESTYNPLVGDAFAHLMQERLRRLSDLEATETTLLQQALGSQGRTP